jgi:hypothetical protein
MSGEPRGDDWTPVGGQKSESELFEKMLHTGVSDDSTANVSEIRSRAGKTTPEAFQVTMRSEVPTSLGNVFCS